MSCASSLAWQDWRQWLADKQQDNLVKSLSRPHPADITTKGLVLSRNRSQHSLMIEWLGHARCLEALHGRDTPGPAALEAGKLLLLRLRLAVCCPCRAKASSRQCSLLCCSTGMPWPASSRTLRDEEREVKQAFMHLLQHRTKHRRQAFIQSAAPAPCALASRALHGRRRATIHVPALALEQFAPPPAATF